MKRFILCLFLFALPLAAQPNNPSVTYVGSAPSGSCSQAPPVQVLNSSGAIYTCDNGTWAVQGGGGSGTVGAGTAGQYARYLANGTTVAGESGTSILVTDPPYNCKCDGSTDDHVCLQASFDSGSGIVNLPVSAGASQFLCATSVPLTFIKSTVLEMNSSGIYFTGNSGYGLTTGGIQTVENGYFQTNSSTGTFGALNLGVDSIVLNVNIFDLLTPPLTYTAIFENNISLTTLIAVSTDGPVVLSSASNPYQYGTSIIDSNFGPATQAFPALLVVGASIPVFNLSSVSIDMTGTPSSATAAAVDFVAPSATVNFNNVTVVSSGSYTGNIFKVDSGTQNLTGSIDTTGYAAGGLGTGTWTGALLYKNTTYRGSAATLTYRCVGGTQAGLIYTNNSSCTGGTAVATGDSVQ